MCLLSITTTGGPTACLQGALIVQTVVGMVMVNVASFTIVMRKIKE